MKELLWVEKYRPNKLDDIASQEDVIQSLRKAIKSKNLPHLIFHGPSGSGKTSTILALAKELFTEEYYKDRIIELNASDERGINVIREKIKTYAKYSINEKEGIPPWKIIILDEADSMTSDSQFALRRIMEEYSKITRFCIICNYYNKIIDPLISRCSLFKFKAIPEKQIMKKLKNISKKEELNLDKAVFRHINRISRGDLRKGINTLQRLKYLSGKVIDEEIFYEISGILPKIKFNKLMNYVYDKNDKEFDKYLDLLFEEGYSFVNQIEMIHNYIIDSELDGELKSKILIRLSELDQKLNKGCNEYILSKNLFYYIMNNIE